MENSGQNIGIGSNYLGRTPAVNQAKSGISGEFSLTKSSRDGVSFSSEAQMLMGTSPSDAELMINILDKQNNIWNSLA